MAATDSPGGPPMAGDCHENFGPLKILVWGAKIFGILVFPGLKFLKILVRLWENGPPMFH